jgi:hypothetical protein
MIDHHADARRAEAVALHLVALQLAARWYDVAEPSRFATT